jgi:hypothetical protein
MVVAALLLLAVSQSSPAFARLANLVSAEFRAGRGWPAPQTGASAFLIVVSTPQSQAQEFSPAVPEQVLAKLRTAIVQEDQQAALACFDPAMPDFAPFADSVRSLFTRYTAFRVRYHILPSGDGSGNMAIVEFTVEATPTGDNRPAERRSKQIRFTFGRSDRGWRVSDLQPRDFFSGF